MRSMGDSMHLFIRLAAALTAMGTGCASGDYRTGPSTSGNVNDAGVVLNIAPTPDGGVNPSGEGARSDSAGAVAGDAGTADLSSAPASDPADTGPRPLVFESYALTRGLYSDEADFNAAVKEEFGPNAVAADWADLKAKFSGRCGAFLDGIGLVTWDDGAMLYSSGQAHYSGSRQYFMARHDGTPRSGFMVHDSIDSGVLDLGSWTPLTAKILVKLQ